ncbi:dihydropteroate synthase [Rhizobium halophytocola]|uniref:Dihydropteroate synthase n=1 Tax=Rhizobium halophytocola TaxID=735519 RepID=A0ABS4DZ72_9HYPH|nr:dihydropteroate synthase [Rhizobium halophytocola]MBP1850992.1 dihydropteroate synthase [Rhizobium halophytocola]
MAETRSWQLAHGRSLALGHMPLIMAVVNVTPDSFSDGGDHAETDAAFSHALTLLQEGAHILDIGGESTRPGATAVSADEEQARILPLIARLVRETEAVISVDSYRPETARLAINAGAHIVNDVWGLQYDPAMAVMTAETGAGICIMHTGRGRVKSADVVVDQHEFLDRSLEIAASAGINPAAIVLDPGFGFNKETAAENFALMARFEALHAFGHPLLVGTSRKRFLGEVTGRDAKGRDIATATTSALLWLKGASVFRVHNVAASRDALAVADAMLRAARAEQEGSDR